MKVSIDRDSCIGCGLCETICPEVFTMDSENIAIVKPDSDVANHKDSVQEAADNCPVSAIQIKD